MSGWLSLGIKGSIDDRSTGSELVWVGVSAVTD